MDMCLGILIGNCYNNPLSSTRTLAHGVVAYKFRGNKQDGGIWASMLESYMVVIQYCKLVKCEVLEDFKLATLWL
jgi:hypothetical protein